MISRIRCYNVLVRLAVYVLPVFAFWIASYIRFGNAWLPDVRTVVPGYYLALLLFTGLVWIFIANYYQVSSVAYLFWEHTGVRAAFLATCSTFLLQTVLLAFVHQLNISRPFILLSDALLFLFVFATRNFFRIFFGSSGWPRKCERILVVGTDQYARRVVKLLGRVPFVCYEVQAYLRIPGQSVLVRDARVINLEELHLEAPSFDSVVVALPAEHYLHMTSLVDGLQSLGKWFCLPTGTTTRWTLRADLAAVVPQLARQTNCWNCAVWTGRAVLSRPILWMNSRGERDSLHSWKRKYYDSCHR